MSSSNGHATSILHERIDSIAGNLKAFVGGVASTAPIIEHRASEVEARTASTASALAAKAGKAIQDDPIAAIGIAFGAGYLIARLARR